MKSRIIFLIVAVCFAVSACIIHVVYAPKAAAVEMSMKASPSPKGNIVANTETQQSSSPSPTPTMKTEPTPTTVPTPTSAPTPTPTPTLTPAPTWSDDKKVAYLTFDDGPSKLTPELLDTLKSCKVHATFFVVGHNAETYTDSLKRIAEEGHVIGIHSWTHDFSYIYKNTDNFLDDFNKLKDYIKEKTGVTPNICRFPGGTNNTACLTYNKNHIMKSVAKLVKDMGFTYYDWNVSSAEANVYPPSTEEIVKTVLEQCKGKHIAVILCHDTNNQGYVDAVPKMISGLEDMGFTFDTLSPDNPPVSKQSAAQFKAS